MFRMSNPNLLIIRCVLSTTENIYIVNVAQFNNM